MKGFGEKLLGWEVKSWANISQGLKGEIAGRREPKPGTVPTSARTSLLPVFQGLRNRWVIPV